MPGTASYTQRSMDFARRCGWRVGIVERTTPGVPKNPTNPSGPRHPGKKHDLFGVADLVALRPYRQQGVLFVQSTGVKQVAKHNKLYRDDADRLAAIQDALLCGNSFEVWGWWERDTIVDRTRWTFRRCVYGLDVDGSVVVITDTKDARPMVLAASERAVVQ